MHYYLLTSILNYQEWEEQRFLLKLSLHLEERHIHLLDYLVEKPSVELLLASAVLLAPSKKLRMVEQDQLPTIISQLGRKGTEYRYSGSYELFHKSLCFCLLGKTGSPALPFSLDAIIAEKRRFSTAKLTITCDEIA
jgi:hypothetical protein